MQCGCGGQTYDKFKQINLEKFEYSECAGCGRSYMRPDQREAMERAEKGARR